MSQHEIVQSLAGMNSLEIKAVITSAERIVKMRKDQRTMWNQLKSAPVRRAV